MAIESGVVNGLESKGEAGANTVEHALDAPKGAPPGATLRRMSQGTPRSIPHPAPNPARHAPEAGHAALPDGSDRDALHRWLDAARAHCTRLGAQLTEQRREVLELLLLRGGSAKAYDLQDDMQTRHGRVAPTTVYRALDFLMDQRLVHKVDATNTYVACSDMAHAHPSMMLVCTACGDIREWHDDPRFHALSAEVARFRPGFEARGLEIKGLCARCTRG